MTREYQRIIRRLIYTRRRFLEPAQQPIEIVRHWQNIGFVHPVGEYNVVDIVVVFVDQTETITVLLLGR